MMWSYITLADGTAIAHSALREDGTVRVAVERPVDMGFRSAICLLPSCRWAEVDGFSPTELDELARLLKSNAPLIFELAERAARGGQAA